MSTGTASILALSAWAAARAGLAIGFRWQELGVLPAVVLGALAVLAALAVRAVSCGSRRPRAGGHGVVVAVLVLVVVSGLGGLLRARAIEEGPLARRARDPTAAEVTGSVMTDPQPTRFGGWSAVLRADHVGVPGAGRQPSRERLLLRADGPAPPIGSDLHVRGLAQRVEGPAAAWWRSQGIVVELAATDVAVLDAPPAWLGHTTWLRDRMSTAAARALPPAQASLLTGLVTGDTTGQPEDLAADVRRSGLAHLVAVSGSNVAMVVAGVLALVLAVGLGRRAAWWVALVAVWWFVVLVRAEPSVLRAAAMATLVLAACLRGRVRDHLHLLWIAVLATVLVDPLLAGRLGFTLSVAATVGVLVAGPRIAASLPVPRLVRQVLGATIGAQLLAAPVLAVAGGTVGVAGVPANVVAVPAATVAGVLGGGAAVVAALSPAGAGPLCTLARPALAVVVWSARTFGGPVGRAIDAAAPMAALSAAVVLAIAALVVRRRPGRVAWTVAVLLAGASVVGPWARTPGGPPDQPVLIALDVGQGDALLLGDPSAGWVLVDGGPDPVLLHDGLARHGVDHLRAVVLSHAHADHDAGLVGLLDRVPVDAVIVGPSTGPTAPAIQAQARSAGVALHRVHAGSSWRLGSMVVTVLSPPPGGIDGDLNETSVVLHVAVEGGLTALLPGDAEVIAQTRLLRDPLLVDVDVLKVAHHGGDTNAEGFLAATTPALAVISVGADNDFGHPHPDVLADLTGIDVRRTDLDGDVVVPLVGPARSGQ